LTLGIVLVVVVIVIGIGAVIRHRLGNAGEKGAIPHSPEYVQALQELDELKTGRIWGDLPSDSLHC